MTPQKIKAGMTQGAWSIKENAFEDDQVYDSTDKAIFNVTGEETTTAQDYANQYAICLAVNNTFGQNINPEKVPIMFELLKNLSYEPKLYEHERRNIQQFIESIKL